MSTADRYLAAAHAMQTGVRMQMTHDGAPDDEMLWPGETSPKHLRVGVNSAMSDIGGLAMLLIEKGIISEEEYMAAITEAMEREVEQYRQRVADRFPDSDTEIVLG